MKAQFRLFAVLFILSTVAVRSFGAVERVPVLMWSSDESVSFAPALAGHVISQDNFRKLYLNQFVADDDIKTIVIFVQDQLSVMDINQNADVYSISSDGGSYRQTKDMMTRMPSAFLANVVSPASALNEIKHNFQGNVYSLHEPFHLVDKNLNADERRLVVVSLPKQHGIGQTDYSLHIDDIISNVTTQAKALLGKFVMVYTGRKPQVRNVFEQQSGRHLLNTRYVSAPENSSAFVESVPGQFLMYTLNISINYNNNQNSTFLSTNKSSWSITAEKDCPAVGNRTGANSSCTVKLEYQNTIPLGDSTVSNFTLNMVFRTTSTGFWYMDKFVVDYKNDTEQSISTVVMNNDFIAQTPLKFSYHCHQAPPIGPKNVSEFDPGFTLNFYGFQIQAFEVQNGFGYYNDCVYFFTIPIFMGLICSAVLLMILFCGLKMMADIKTMDRMDDPKGKTISVTVAE